MLRKWNQWGKVIWSVALERPETRVCCGEDHRCGSGTGETHFCTNMGRLHVQVYAWPNSKHPTCKIQLLMHKNRIRLFVLVLFMGELFVLTWCLQRHWLPVCMILVLICASPERVCVQSWGLHAQPHGELGHSTGDCSSLVLSDQDGRNPFWSRCPLLKHFLYLTSFILVVLL